jgi:ABC-type lipoprotein release transport system permease subunit
MNGPITDITFNATTTLEKIIIINIIYSNLKILPIIIKILPRGGGFLALTFFCLTSPVTDFNIRSNSGFGNVPDQSLALFISVVVGISAGMIPAYQGSKLKPADALRYE